MIALETLLLHNRLVHFKNALLKAPRTLLYRREQRTSKELSFTKGESVASGSVIDDMFLLRSLYQKEA
jgi:hypothetical protein